METTQLSIQEKSPFIVNYEKTHKEIRRKRILSFTDTLISVFIVGPLTIAFWRGTWELTRIYERFLPFWESYAFGVVVHVILAITKESLEELTNFEKTSWGSQTLEFVLRRFYTYVFACSCIFFWEPSWHIFDKMCKIEFLSSGVSTVNGIQFYIMNTFVVMCVFCLIFLRCCRNLTSPPLAVMLDKKKVTFYFPTRFRKSMEEKTFLYVLDCLFSVLIIGTLVVFVWRGAWVLLDIYIYPDSLIWSSWASLILGYAIVAMAFLLQPIMRWLCDRITGLPRLIVADIFLLFSFAGTVNVWRGIWNLLNLYFLPDNRELSSWITHWVCLVLLILLKCSNTLLVRGVYIDAEEHAGKCVVFPIYYLRLIFQHERAKKINKKFELEAMARRKLEMESKSGCTCGMEIKNHIAKENVQNHFPDV